MQRTHRKRGIFDSRIISEKTIALEATYTAHDDGKRAVMTLTYGARPATDVQRAVARRLNQPSHIDGALWFTEHGDFTHLAGRGI